MAFNLGYSVSPNEGPVKSISLSPSKGLDESFSTFIQIPLGVQCACTLALYFNPIKVAIKKLDQDKINCPSGVRKLVFQAT